MPTTNHKAGGYFIAHDDIWLLDGVRTPFIDYNSALGLVSPPDLGIKSAPPPMSRATRPAGRPRTCLPPYILPRHIGLYSGVPLDRPALLVQRVCGTGIEALSQAADAITLKKIELGLCVGAESMSRNPIAA